MRQYFKIKNKIQTVILKCHNSPIDIKINQANIVFLINKSDAIAMEILHGKFKIILNAKAE